MTSSGRSSLRQPLGLLILTCAAVLTFGAGPALAAGPTPRQAEQSPTELWQEYPLEPMAGQPDQTKRQSIPDLQPAAVARPSSRDSMLLIGGLALVILVLADTAFLTLSVRLLRRAS